MRTVAVWDDTLGTERECQGQTCTQRLVFARTERNNKPIPIHAEAVPVRTRIDEQSGRMIAEYSDSDVHFGKCPDVQQFRR